MMKDFKLDINLPDKQVVKEKLIAGTIGMTLGLGFLVGSSVYFSIYKWEYRSPILVQLQSPLVISKYPEEMLSPVVETVEAMEATPSATPAPTPETVSKAPQPEGDLQNQVYGLIGEIWGDDAELGRRMAWCESRYGTQVENTSSSARGVFQFIARTWQEQRAYQGDDTDLALRFDLRENITTAYNHYKRMGTTPWNASKHCWN